MARLLLLLSLVTAAIAAAVVVLPISAEAADVFVAPSGSGRDCSESEPCGSLDAAYRAAAPGDVVELDSGAYGPQVLPAMERSSPAVEIRAAKDAKVTLGGLDIRADNVVVRGVRTSGSVSVDSENAADPVEGVRLYDVHATTHWINNARDFVWSGGSIGPSFNTKASMVGGQPPSYRLTYDRVLWHDATRDSADVHMECFYVASVQGLTIRNSRFHNCAVFDILITQLGNDAQPRDIVIENTVLEESKDVGGAAAFYSFMVHENVSLNGLVLRNNVWELPFAVNGSVSNARAVGNIGVSGWDGGCRAGVSYARNVFTRGRCGSSDTVAPSAFSQFVNPGGSDWRLKAGAAAIDAADPRDHPSRDALGHVRPIGGAPDAGAYEYGSGPPGDAGENTGSKQPPQRAPSRKGEGRRARVQRVIDGRTLRVKLKGGRRTKVRLLGIKPPKRRCGGRHARARLRALAPRGAIVMLRSDPAARRRDARGRLRAYVSRSGHDVGLGLIKRGWARFSSPSPQLRRHGRYAAAQRKATRQRKGMWRRCR